MTFKKDYINYVLYSVLNGSDNFRANERMKALVSRIIATDDIVKITYVVGKTAGLDILFKYLLYISDKIDKSQITVFNLKDNFDYDVQNLTKFFGKLLEYRSGSLNKNIDRIEIRKDETKQKEQTKGRERIKIDVSDKTEIPVSSEDSEIYEEEIIEDDNAPALTLIENSNSGEKEAEVFELSEISDDIENTVNEDSEDTSAEDAVKQDETAENNDEIPEEKVESDDIITEEQEEVFELEDLDEEVEGTNAEDSSNLKEPETGKPEPVIEIEVRKPVREYEETEEVVKEESVTNEAYYKFESKFFEEVKILEKLFVTVERESKVSETGKTSERCLQCLTEIIEITSELSNLSRQLSFDLIADIFLTMNLYFTKAISGPEIINDEKIRLLDSSLALVNSLIKGEDYLNYDVIVDKLELLRNEMQRPAEESIVKQVVTSVPVVEPETELVAPEESYEQPAHKPEDRMKQSELESVNFKMRYLIKEFEKSFASIGNIKGEYKKFDALEKVDELNNALRLIAKISSAVKMRDVLKLSEVAYVFLKYLKDYRMDLMDPEIQQIVKYIIFTFKMLLTDRKPEDFNVLVQYLNNPVKIFADS